MIMYEHAWIVVSNSVVVYYIKHHGGLYILTKYIDQRQDSRYLHGAYIVLFRYNQAQMLSV